MKCENCGREPLANTDIVISPLDEGGARIVCKQCAAQYGTCAMCQHNIPCGFFNDPDPIPQFRTVSRAIRQGNATFVEQRQVPNSERIKKFCTDGKCKCFLDDAEHPLCCRHGGYTTCTNYCELEKYKFGEDFSTDCVSEN